MEIEPFINKYEYVLFNHIFNISVDYHVYFIEETDTIKDFGGKLEGEEYELWDSSETDTTYIDEFIKKKVDKLILSVEE